MQNLWLRNTEGGKLVITIEMEKETNLSNKISGRELGLWLSPDDVREAVRMLKNKSVRFGKGMLPNPKEEIWVVDVKEIDEIFGEKLI